MENLIGVSDSWNPKILAIRIKTTVGQKFPDYCHEKKKAFSEYAHKKIQDKNLNRGQIINMNDASVLFECCSSWTINATSEKKYFCTNDKKQKDSFACTAD